MRGCRGKASVIRGRVIHGIAVVDGLDIFVIGGVIDDDVVAVVVENAAAKIRIERQVVSGDRRQAAAVLHIAHHNRMGPGLKHRARWKGEPVATTRIPQLKARDIDGAAGGVDQFQILVSTARHAISIGIGVETARAVRVRKDLVYSDTAKKRIWHNSAQTFG